MLATTLTPTTNGTDSKLALLASRPEMVYQYNVHLEHVSGDDWLAIYKSALGSRLPVEYFPSKFRLNGTVPEGERRPANLEDVFVLLTGEEIA